MWPYIATKSMPIWCMCLLFGIRKKQATHNASWGFLINNSTNQGLYRRASPDNGSPWTFFHYALWGEIFA